MMTYQQILDAIPDYAKDQRVNLQNVLAQAELTEQQTWTCAAACALACRNEAVSEAILAEAAGKLSPEQLVSAKAAFGVMQMNNIFYRFKHMVHKAGIRRCAGAPADAVDPNSRRRPGGL